MWLPIYVHIAGRPLEDSFGPQGNFIYVAAEMNWSEWRAKNSSVPGAEPPLKPLGPTSSTYVDTHGLQQKEYRKLVLEEGVGILDKVLWTGLPSCTRFVVWQGYFRREVHKIRPCFLWSSFWRLLLDIYFNAFHAHIYRIGEYLSLFFTYCWVLVSTFCGV